MPRDVEPESELFRIGTQTCAEGIKSYDKDKSTIVEDGPVTGADAWANDTLIEEQPSR